MDIPVTSQSRSALQNNMSASIMENFLSNKVHKCGTVKKYLKLWNGKIYLFQTYNDNNEWLHYLILFVVLVEEIQLNVLYVHKKHCQNKLHVYNIPSTTAKK